MTVQLLDRRPSLTNHQRCCSAPFSREASANCELRAKMTKALTNAPPSQPAAAPMDLEFSTVSLFSRLHSRSAPLPAAVRSLPPPPAPAAKRFASLGESSHLLFCPPLNLLSPAPYPALHLRLGINEKDNDRARVPLVTNEVADTKKREGWWGWRGGDKAEV